MTATTPISWRALRLMALIPVILAIIVQTAGAAQAPNDTTGTVVSFTTIALEDVSLASDGAGGQWLAWTDTNADPTRVLVQHFDQAGNEMYAPGGEPLAAWFQEQKSPQIMADGNGGIYLSYTVYFPGTSITDYVNFQHLDASGSQVWGIGGSAPSNALNYTQTDPQMVMTSTGLAVAWHEDRSGAPGIYAQRFNATGDRLWGDTGVRVDETATAVVSPRVTWLGNNTLAVAWQETRGLGDTGIFWQNIQSGVNLIATGGASIFRDASIEYTEPQIGVSSDGQLLATARARELSGASDAAVYAVAQKIDRFNFQKYWGGGSPRNIGVVAIDGLYGDANIHDIKMLPDASGGMSVFYAFTTLGFEAPANFFHQQGIDYRHFNSSGSIVAGGSGYLYEHNGSLNGLQLLAVTEITAGDFAWVFKTNTQTTVTRSRLDESIWWFPYNIAFTQDYAASHYSPVFAGCTGNADKTVVTWLEPNNMIYRLRYIGFDQYGNAGHIPPVVTAAEDVAHDQGRQMRVSWLASNLDSPAHQGVNNYSVWRNDSGTWVHMQTVPAVGLPQYAATIATLADSTAGDPAWTEVRVMAHGANPTHFWTSASLSGYSVNNLGGAGVTVLNKAYPNPFNPSTTLSFSLKSAGPAALEIYDLAGHRIAVIVNEGLAAGAHDYIWQGQNEQGGTVSSGIYFARLKTSETVRVQSLTLIK